MNRKGRTKKTIRAEDEAVLRDALENEQDNYVALIKSKIGDSFPNEEVSVRELESIIDKHFAQERQEMMENGIVTNE
jgi:DeoR/GlpR family transcriptional regulator of sugar metabolism